MKALFTFGADVPVSRVIADHRRWLMPVGVVLAINVIVLIAVVLPLRQSVQSGIVARRRVGAGAARSDGRLEGSRSDARRTDAGVRAISMRFYAEVLPADISRRRAA